MPAISDSDKLKLPSPSFNWAVGGGLVPGKIVTIYGPESAGKTMISLIAVASLHASDPEAWAIWYDAEFSFNKEWAAQLGVDNTRLIVRQKNAPAEIFDHFYDKMFPAMQDGFPLKMMVIDSIQALKGPKEAKAKSVEDHIMGDISTVLPKAFRKIIEPIRKYKVITICVQQVRMNMDPVGAKYRPWLVPGGQALKHASDYMILVEKINAKDTKVFDETQKTIRKKPVQLGHRVRVTVEKNRTNDPYRDAEFTIAYKKGIIEIGREVAELGVTLGIIQNPVQGTYVIGNEKVRGIASLIEEFNKRPELQREVMDRIYSENPVPLPKKEGNE